MERAQNYLCVPGCWNNTTATLDKLAYPPLRHCFLLYCLLLIMGNNFTIISLCGPCPHVPLYSWPGISVGTALRCRDALKCLPRAAGSRRSRGWGGFPGKSETGRKKLVRKLCHQLHVWEEEQELWESPAPSSPPHPVLRPSLLHSRGQKHVFQYAVSFQHVRAKPYFSLSPSSTMQTPQSLHSRSAGHPAPAPTSTEQSLLSCPRGNPAQINGCCALFQVSIPSCSSLEFQKLCAHPFSCDICALPKLSEFVRRQPPHKNRVVFIHSAFCSFPYPGTFPEAFWKTHVPPSSIPKVTAPQHHSVCFCYLRKARWLLLYESYQC